MNTAAKAYDRNYAVNSSFLAFLFSKQVLIFLVLGFGVMISALGVVYVKQNNRQLFMQMVSLQRTQDSAHTQWGQLLLEQNTLATQARVQVLAQTRLDMKLPQAKNMKIVKLSAQSALTASMDDNE